MAAYRCSSCSIDWPQEGAFQPCPKCGGETSLMYAAKSMALDEAWSKKRHYQFEKWLEEEPPERRQARECAALQEEADELARLEALVNGPTPTPQEAIP